MLAGIDLSGKTALVTGGYSGIGTETSRALVEAGCEVYAPARRTDVALNELEGIVPAENIVEMDLATPNQYKILWMISQAMLISLIFSLIMQALWLAPKCEIRGDGNCSLRLTK
ncbi:MAG: hypothetical protein CM1200mP12_03930 [Gammaproteobacteria bacterium]|nr:MAG: hypothetical protein CM1200mP12_03930 [Gammaproteobacteria bacterium]